MGGGMITGLLSSEKTWKAYKEVRWNGPHSIWNIWKIIALTLAFALINLLDFYWFSHWLLSTSLPSTVLNFKEESKGYKYFVVKIATLFVNYSQKEVSLHFLLRIDEYFDGDHLPMRPSTWFCDQIWMHYDLLQYFNGPADENKQQWHITTAYAAFITDGTPIQSWMADAQ